MLRGSRVLLVAGALALPACSIKRLAVNSVANALAKSGDVYASDVDPQLIREALPFALKTQESLLAQAPRHRGLLVATASAFTSYAQGFVVRDAELLEQDDIEAGESVRRRAQRLLTRARDYALRALDVDHPGIAADLRAGRVERLAETSAKDVPALYWAGASWGAAVSVLKDDTDLISDLPAVRALIDRVLALDEGFSHGAAHEVMIRLESGLAGGSLERAEGHYSRAIALSRGTAASPHVAFAETACVKRQDRARFVESLHAALAVDPDREPSLRVANRLAQDRARWLERRIDDLFLE
jgi:predicted anti-sigma-YlaC factor YlaD